MYNSSYDIIFVESDNAYTYALTLVCKIKAITEISAGSWLPKR
jgi:hypothetical protein